MSALYLSMSWAQAASFPRRHSFTRRVSFHFVAGVAGALVLAGFIEWSSPAHFLDTAARHSTKRRVRGLRDGSCQGNFLRRPGCPGWREKSWAGTRREFLAHDHRAFFAVRRCGRTFAPR